MHYTLKSRSFTALGLLAFAALSVASPTTTKDGIGPRDAETSKLPTGVDPITVFNKLGTWLTGYDGCSKAQEATINTAYDDAHKILNIDGVNNNIDWEHAAAQEFFGPVVLNKDQQAQIQAVLTNAATITWGWSRWLQPFKNYIRVRCDDPLERCSFDPLGAYAQNQIKTNPKQKEPYINFCPYFFNNLDSFSKRLSDYSHDDNYYNKYSVETYALSQGPTFLHELLHLDSVADSINDKPNPKVYDVEIRYHDSGDNDEIKTSKAYGAKLAKVLARFRPNPRRKESQTGWWVQRNDDNLGRFALARYIEGVIGSYPFLPEIVDTIKDPLKPRPRPESVVTFKTTSDGQTRLGITDKPQTGGDADGNVEIFEVGSPIEDNLYSKAYLDQRTKWQDQLKNGSQGNCNINMIEVWTCEDVASNLYGRVTFKDAQGALLYSTPGSAHSPGIPINDKSPLHLKEGKMQDTLTIVAEHTGDYIQFAYGSTNWKSSDTSGKASCKLAGQDWDKNGPKNCPKGEALSRTFECQFPC